MSPVVRKVVIAAMIVVLLPAAAFLSLGLLRWFGLGLRMEDEKTKTQYLIGAAENRARSEVERLLKLGIVAANAEDEFGYTALMGAALGGDAEIVRLLLDRGASINATVRKSRAPNMPAGTTALMRAAEKGHLEAVSLLLDRGADLNSAIPEGTYKGYTALFVAVLSGNAALVDALLSKGANVAAYWIDGGYYPFTIALRDNRLDIAERLVAAGSSVNWTVPSGPLKGCTLLMQLVGFQGHPVTQETVSWLARRSRRTGRRAASGACKDWSAIEMAATYRNIAAVKALLEPGVKGYAGLGQLQRASWLASRENHHEVAKLLDERVRQCEVNRNCPY